VIEATGYVEGKARSLAGSFSLYERVTGGRTIAQQFNYSTGRGVLTVGPASELPLEPYETQALSVNVGENTVALWRYADRTAQIATQVAREEVK
jgi:hypothetical protein